MAPKTTKSNLLEFNLKMPKGMYRVFWLREQLGDRPGIRRGFYGESMGMHTTFYASGGMHHEVNGTILPYSEVATPAFKDIDEAYQIGYSAMPVENITSDKMATKIERLQSESPNRIITLDLGDYHLSLDTSIHLVRKNSLHSFLQHMLKEKKNIMFGNNLKRLVGIDIVGLECFTDFTLVIFLISGEDSSV